MNTIENYVIPEWNLYQVHETIEKLNRRAKKNNLPPLLLTLVGEQVVDDPRLSKDEKADLLQWGAPIPQVKLVEFTLSAEPVKLAGWTFLGTLDHTLEGVVIVKTVPGQNIPEKYFHSPAICNHCNKIRRRTETFVVRHENGEEKQVGRQCVQDFFGTDPHALLAQLTKIFRLIQLLVNREDESYWGYGRAEITHSTDTVLTYTAAVIRVSGWVSRKIAQTSDLVATSTVVSDILSPPRAGSGAYKDWVKLIQKYQPTDADKEVVPLARQWVSEQPTNTEYMHNLAALNKLESVPYRMFGFVCSMVSSYQKHMETLRLKKLDKRISEWIGNVKEKITLEVKLVSVRAFDGFYGETYLYSMSDSEGRTVLWFAAGNSDAMAVDKSYKVQGTVKKHDDYKGWKQTVLTRVKVLQELDTTIKVP